MSDAHGHGDKPFLQHHYEDEDHQFDAGKLGIWAFLVTEVLFFSGLFCAYAIYRRVHPEVFEYAAQALDTNLGAVNTCVLLLSSLTAAWAVRNAQLGQKNLLVANLAVTIACAFGFMGIKYVEYTHKFHLNIYPGKASSEYYEGAFGDEAKAEKVAFVVPDQEGETEQGGEGAGDGGAHSEGGGDHDGEGQEAEGDHAEGDHAEGDHAEGDGADGAHEEHVAWDDPNIDPVVKSKLSIFFGIYYCMTGLHGIHVVLGIVVLGWLLTRAIRGHFTPTYYGPIDYAALYWHLVDLIWIYLFPLLYLIN